ncbi:MAG TPA: hypothetical protein O0W79_05540 [Methanocorpusculum sp.]|nr:hypothetical protein [Methanocorpusculum sp.]
MAVQSKSKRDATGPKKQVNWVQVCVVGLCIIVVVMCILSFSNFSNFFNDRYNAGSVAEGDTVSVYYSTFVGDVATYTLSTTIVAGQTYEENQFIDVDGFEKKFVLYADELTNMAKGIVNQSYGSTILVSGVGTDAETYATTYTKEEFLENSGSITEEQYDAFVPGDVLVTTDSNAYFITTGEDDSMTIDFGVRPAVITAVDATSITYNIGSDNIAVVAVAAA